MQNFIKSQLRHFITAVSFLIGFLVVRGLVSHDEAALADSYLLQHIDTIAGFLATFITRSLLWFSGKLFMGKKLGSVAGLSSCITVLFSLSLLNKFGMGVFLAVMALVFSMGLSSCQSLQDFAQSVPKNVEFKVFKRFDDNSKAGLSISDGEGTAYARKTFVDENGNVMFEAETEVELLTRPVVNPQK